MTTKLVIFGASGDLTSRYLMPALAQLADAGHLPEDCEIIGTARQEWDTGNFRGRISQALHRHADDVSREAQAALISRLSFRAADVTDAQQVRAVLGEPSRSPVPWRGGGVGSTIAPVAGPAETSGETARNTCLCTAGQVSIGRRREGVTVCHPEDVDTVLTEIARDHAGTPARAEDFVAPGAYLPLPTIVQAARQLFETRELPYIKRARSAPEPALEAITAIAH